MRSSPAIALVLLAQAAAAQEGLVLKGHLSEARSVAFFPDGKTLASGGGDGVRLWDVATGKAKGWLKTYVDSPGMEHTSENVVEIALSPDGKSLAVAHTMRPGTGGKGCPIALWDLGSGSWRTLDGENRRMWSVTFAPDGKTIAAGGQLGVYRWDASGNAQPKWPSEGYAVWVVRFSPDGKLLAVGETDHKVRLLDAASLALKATIDGPNGNILALAFSPDGNSLAIGSDTDKGSNLILWSVTTGKEIARLSGPDSGITGLGFSRDGQWLVSASRDASVRVWSVAQKKVRILLGKHDGAAAGVAVSPDGKTVASAGADHAVRLFDASP